MQVITNGRLVLEEEVRVGNLLIRDGKIAKILPVDEVPEGADIIDAKGRLVFPGFIDPHVHMQMTNAFCTTADSYATGSVAALHGGVTTIVNFATAAPGMALKDVLQTEKAKADEKCAVDYLFHVEMIDVNDSTLQELAELPALGVASIKAYMAYGFRIDDGELYQTVKGCRDSGLLLEAHCEDGDLLAAMQKEMGEEGHVSFDFKAKAHPPEAEAIAIHALGAIGKLLKAPVHVVHLSSRLGLETVRMLRKEGVDITVETCPQYLYLDENVYDLPAEEAAMYVCAPVPRTKRDREAILKAVLNGEIQTLATDHCAYNREQKHMNLNDFRKTPGGLPGIEERAALMYTKLVVDNGMNLNDFARLMATNAAVLYGLYPKKGVIEEGADADLVVFDPEAEKVFDDDNIHSACGYTAYVGTRVRGNSDLVFLRGKLVKDEETIVDDAHGTYVGPVR